MNHEGQDHDEVVTTVDENPLARGAAVTGLLAAGALYYLYRRSRSTPVEDTVVGGADGADTLVRRGQQVLETTLDRLSDQAMADVKVILKTGLRRLEQIVDDL